MLATILVRVMSADITREEDLFMIYLFNKYDVGEWLTIGLLVALYHA